MKAAAVDEARKAERQRYEDALLKADQQLSAANSATTQAGD
jgi:hypothetical protein